MHSIPRLSPLLLASWQLVADEDGFGDSDPKNKTGWLTAVDADSEKVLGKYHSSLLIAGISPSASCRVFARNRFHSSTFVKAATNAISEDVIGHS
jgi:hypothetical protein